MWEDALELARALLTTDAYSEARLILQDTPEETFGTREKWFIVGTLAAAVEEAHAETEKIRVDMWGPGVTRPRP